MDHEVKLRQLLMRALSTHCSDIHLTRRRKDISLEFRTLQGQIESQNQSISESLFEYLKYRAHIDLLTPFAPQTGRMECRLSDVTYYLRLAYMKNNAMETMVLRILNPPAKLTMEELFESTHQLTLTQKLVKRPNGLILFSGTTGSGKTTSMICCLDSIQEGKIYTVEDPIEVIRDNWVQFEVKAAQNFSFQEAIKQILRHDPNIIVIGEIRSPQEAQAALRSALSGHLVFSTIHANSAELTLRRLIEFGIEKELLHEALVAIYYQTLDYDETSARRRARFTILDDFKQLKTT